MGIKRQNTIKADGGMSSMTDLVFLLLIFFVILSTMASTGIQVNTPKGGGGKQPINEAVVSIKVENGIHRVYVGDKEFTHVNRDTDEIDIQRLEQELVPLLGEKKAVELKAAKDVKYDYPAQVINLVKQKQWTIVLIFKTT